MGAETGQGAPSGLKPVKTARMKAGRGVGKAEASLTTMASALSCLCFVLFRGITGSAQELTSGYAFSNHS